MSDNRKLQGCADFTHEVFRYLASQIHGHIRVMLEYIFDRIIPLASDYCDLGVFDLIESLPKKNQMTREGHQMMTLPRILLKYRTQKITRKSSVQRLT